MRHKTVGILESETMDIALAKKEIADICSKYDVSLLGEATYYDSEWDSYSTTYTADINVVSEKYKRRLGANRAAEAVKEKHRYECATQRLLKRTMEQYPNHLNLDIYEEEWLQPNYFGHKPWKTTSIFVSGLRVKDWSLICEPLFFRNANGFWQYRKYRKDNQVCSDVSLRVYPEFERPTLFSHPGVIKHGVYADGSAQNDIQSQAFVVQMVDELIASGALELKGA